MPLTVTDFLAFSFVGFLFLGGFFLGPVLLLMHILMPKEVLQNYFKPPFFRPAEIAFFSGIPFAPVRTSMLMWVLAFPHFGKKRNLTEAYKLAPPWYRTVSAIFSIVIIISYVGVLTTGIGFYIYNELLGKS